MPGTMTEKRWRAILFIMSLYLVNGVGLFAQGTRITGRILDRASGTPIPDVSVYINGSSLGTTTDAEGAFKLEGMVLPCELIVSHVSYELQSRLLLDPSTLEGLLFPLDVKVVMLEEATVIQNSIRNEFLERFKKWFLGRDFEAYDAEILNDTILIFSIDDQDQFSVYANEPLMVSLPETGYLLKVDLVKFDLRYNQEFDGYHCSILGYYLFNPMNPGSPRGDRVIARKRAEHYYNSSMHFCRSLYHNMLAENGYLFERNCPSEEEGDDSRPDFVANYLPDPYGNTHLLLTRLACRRYGVTFYYNARNRPVDLTYLDSNPTRQEWSGVYFMKDTIRIYPSGRIPENSILFSNSISNKGVASMLPEDYIPSMR